MPVAPVAPGAASTAARAALAALAAVTLAACHHAASLSSQPTPERTRADSLAAEQLARGGRARSDSMAARNRADTQAQLAAERRHADSVRAEVRGEMGEAPVPLTRWGLSDRDSLAMMSRIHFAFDKSVLTPEDLTQLEAKRQLLVAHPNLVIQIAGNCDERGSDEYNLALGERRAAAAKRWLVDHGIADGRISIISYGKERPLDPGHTEQAWAKNRRDDFLVTRPAQ